MYSSCETFLLYAILSLRRIGVVGQEPVLFGCSIGDNIRYGREGVTDEDVERACKEANAYGFIQKLPKVSEQLIGRDIFKKKRNVSASFKANFESFNMALKNITNVY